MYVLKYQYVGLGLGGRDGYGERGGQDSVLVTSNGHHKSILAVVFINFLQLQTGHCGLASGLLTPVHVSRSSGSNGPRRSA